MREALNMLARLMVLVLLVVYLPVFAGAKWIAQLLRDTMDSLELRAAQLGAERRTRREGRRP